MHKGGKLMKHKKRLNKTKVLITILLGAFFIYSIQYVFQDIGWLSDSVFDDGQVFEYEVIKEDTNDVYLGKGQERLDGKEGYFSTFTTINHKIYKEYKQNQDPWKNKEYWKDNMEESGCGITAMSIILSGYGINKTPEDLRKCYYPVLNGEKISGELKKFGINNSDFYFDSIHLSRESLNKHLNSNRPVLICVWNKPNENRWTTSSHYMVLLASDGDNKVYVSNPNGGKNNYKSSGWYKYEEIQPYIAKAMYIEEY